MTDPTMVQAQILYANLLRSGTVTYSATPVSGFEPVNAYDWRDFTLFRPQAAATLTVTLSGASAADSMVVWWMDAMGSDTVNLHYWDGAAWVWVAIVGQSSGAMSWVDFDSASSTIWRLTFSGSQNIRQIALGVKVQFPIGQWADVNPPTLLQGVVVQNVISVNGSILGRNIKRIEKSGKLSLNLLLPDWVRTVWNDFAIHASKLAFFHRWDPVGHPTEVAFAVASEINAPTNDRPQPRMKVDMPIRFITT